MKYRYIYPFYLENNWYYMLTFVVVEYGNRRDYKANLSTSITIEYYNKHKRKTYEYYL